MRLVYLLSFLAVVVSLQSQTLDMKQFEHYAPRSIGPAGMSGRVTAIDVVHNNPDIIYLGTASGGLWKSTGGGVVWKPIFDEQPVASIGAIAINQNNPAEIWVGTGEGNPRNSQASGNGVYKSIDGGKTWTHLGLERTRNIHRIFIHPDNSKVIYVGAIGSAWGDTQARGVYRTQDGGKTWKKILYVNNRTGVGDMVVDPSNPNKMLVGMWEYRRWPWFFKSGGKGSGLYLTLDGGDTWKKLNSKDNGLPKGELGRIGLAIAPSNPNHIYALIESKKNALYVSMDGGEKWTKINDKDIGDRPFYYADLAVDSENENRLYNVFSNVKVSNDGGKTFKMLLGWDRVHGDHHAWWIHPKNGRYIINGNDGGAAISRDRGQTWRFVENLPVGQFYHISVDMAQPYNILGGMQDNGSWRGPSKVWRNGGIRNAYWEEISFGDGFDVLPDPTDSRYLYSMWQGGNLLYIDLKTGQENYIRPTDASKKLRYNWNAAIAADPFDNSIYYGSQYVHQTKDKGKTWTIISPVDLTTNDATKQKQDESGGLTYDVTNAENHTTITAITPSKRERNLIWVGTDDGNIQLTRDGGKEWEKVSDNLYSPPKKKSKAPKPILPPKNSWVTQIHASNFKDGEAFVVMNNYRRNDWTPYLLHTQDYGKTWKNLVDKNKVWGYCLSFVQDLEVPELLFLGTEFGLYVSLDAGKNWNRWTQKAYPTASTMDMVIHPREHDLVIGTFGRSIFVLDDIRPLRALARDKNIMAKNLHIFQPPPAYQAYYKEATGTRFSADAIYKGKNKPYGAQVTYYTKDTEKDTLKVEVFEGETRIRAFEVTAHPGFNRFDWALARDGVRFPKTPKPKKIKPKRDGYGVMPGTYTLRLIDDKDTVQTTVEVKLDPRLEIDETGLKRQYESLLTFEKMVKVATQAADRLRAAKGQIGKIAALNKKPTPELKKTQKELKQEIEKLLRLFYPAKSIQGIFRSSDFIDDELKNASFRLAYTKDVPFQTQELTLAKAKTNLNKVLSQVNTFFDQKWAKYVAEVKKLELELVEKYDKLQTIKE